MTKELTLTISERVAAAKILNGFKGDLTVLSLLIEDIKKIAITEDEWAKAELKKTPIINEKGEPSGQESWNWQDKKELDKKIELIPDTVLYLLNDIKAKEEKKEITMADIPLITLKAKLQ